MCFNGLRGNSEVSAQKAKNTVCFVGYIVNVLILSCLERADSELSRTLAL